MYTREKILELIDGPYTVQGSLDGRSITNVKTVSEADQTSLAWIDPARSDKAELLASCRAGVVISDGSLNLPQTAHLRQLLIQVPNPKLTLIKIVSRLFKAEPTAGIHPTAVIHPQAKIAGEVYIGALANIGKAEIGAGCEIYGNVHIYDNVTLGKNVIVQAGSVIGVAGFSLAKDETGEFQNFPHLGGVVIEDDVEIQALCVIDRGVLSDTVIGQGSKINSGVYIGHNCRIGRRNFIAGHTMISGSVTTGDDCWFGPSSVVRDQLRIGANAFVGTGSVVVASLEENARVMGNPARAIAEAKSLSKTLKRLRDADSGDTE